MLKCCAACPGDRPSFSTLHHVFKSLHSTANDGQYITLDVDMNNAYYLISPRNSTIEASVLTDDCVPLMMDQIEVDTVEVTSPKTHHVLPLNNGYTNPSSQVTDQHTRTASYSYSETGFLPCITEEGEDVSDEDEMVGADEEEREKRDSGNDSASSHDDSGSRKLTKESDKDDSEENLVMDGKSPATIELL